MAYYCPFSCDMAQAVISSVASYRLKQSPLRKTPTGQPRDRVVIELPAKAQLTWVKLIGLSLVIQSAYLQANIPQSLPFICCGIS